MSDDRNSKEINDIQKLYIKLNFWASIINQAIKWGALLGISGFFYKSVAALSGKATLAKFLIKIIGDFSINEYIWYALALFGTGYGLVERRLRKNKVKKLSERNKKLELLIDKNRTSSNLNPEGELNKGEEL